jgi:hypothetical protein
VPFGQQTMTVGCVTLPQQSPFAVQGCLWATQHCACPLPSPFSLQTTSGCSVSVQHPDCRFAELQPVCPRVRHALPLELLELPPSLVLPLFDEAVHPPPASPRATARTIVRTTAVEHEMELDRSIRAQLVLRAGPGRP